MILSAYACEPGRGSEPGVGWLFLRCAADVVAERGDVQVVAIIHDAKVPLVRAALDARGVGDCVTLVGVPVPKLFTETAVPMLHSAGYLAWWSRARRRAWDEVRRGRTALAWHATFASEILPTPIGGLPTSVYKVWGPVGSAGDPRVFRIPPTAPGGRRQAWMQALRNDVAPMLARFHGRRMDRVLFTVRGPGDRFRGRAVVEEFSNVALAPEALTALASAVGPGSGQGPAILCGGLPLVRKRFELAIAALAEEPLAGAHLSMAGGDGGGVTKYLKSLADELGVADRVTWMGRLDRADWLRQLAGHDVLFHPSAREGPCWVVAEALSAGTPVVCFDQVGAASTVRLAGSPGIILDAGKTTIRDIAEAVAQAASLERRPAPIWTEDRIRAKIAEILGQVL
jgi:hypothetical protein